MKNQLLGPGSSMFLAYSREPGSRISVGISLRITTAQFASKLLAEILEQAQILSVVFVIYLYLSKTRQSDTSKQ